MRRSMVDPARECNPGAGLPLREIVTVPMSNERADLSTTRALRRQIAQTRPLSEKDISGNYGSYDDVQQEKRGEKTKGTLFPSFLRMSDIRGIGRRGLGIYNAPARTSLSNASMIAPCRLPVGVGVAAEFPRARPEDRRVRPSQARNTSARPRSAWSARLRRAGYVHPPLRVEVIDVVRNLQARCASDLEKAPSATREHDRVQPPTLNLYAQRREGGLESPTQYSLSDQNLISRERPRLDSHRRSLRAAGQS
jgi:hypothetical protein